MQGNLYLKYLFVLFFALTILSCNDTTEQVDPEEETPISPLADSYSLSVASDWQDLHLHLIKTMDGYVPPIAARSLAYVNLALYESTVYGTKNKSLVGQIYHLESLPKPVDSLKYNWGLAANVAQYTILKELFFEASQENQDLMNALRLKYETELKAGETQEVIERSIKFGADVATAIWEFAKTDGGHERYKNPFAADYIIPKGLGFWKPVGNQLALLPEWSKNRYLLYDNAMTFVNIPPIPFSYRDDSEFFAQANEVYEINQEFNESKEAIAHFWDDGAETITPVGHHINIATILLKAKDKKLGFAAETYVKMAIGLNDGFISCWRGKYRYNLMRPITYIHQTIDNTWQSLLENPPFPEYASGHSTGAGVSAEILANQFGENTSFIDNTYEGKYPNRSFSTITQYAVESSISRLYGGIHYRFSCEEGLKHGREIARNVLNLDFKK